MDDLEKYIQKRKKKDTHFAKGFEEGYEEFKIGIMLRQAREDAAMVQRIQREGIDWLSPTIFEIPVTSIWPLVGLPAPKKVL